MIETLDDIRTHFPLQDARLCCNCQTVTTETRNCPSCTSEILVPLGVFVKPMEYATVTTT